MEIQQIIKKRENLTGGVFRICKGNKGWEFRDITGALPFVPGMVENEDGLPYFPVEGEVVDAATIIDFDATGNVKGLVARLFPVAGKATSFMTLPREKLPNPREVIELERMIQSLSIAPLRNFCIALFRNEVLALKYATAKASWKYHHCEKGGLLAHSLEMARQALRSELPIALSTTEREIVAVAAIVHDIGKIKAYGESSKILRGRHHEIVGMTIIAGPLGTMEKEWSEGAHALLAVLSECALSKHRHRNEMSMILSTLDRSSAFVDAKNRAFKGKSRSQKYASVEFGNSFWRMSDYPTIH